nr:hypothetical protein 2 [bacterium]
MKNNFNDVNDELLRLYNRVVYAHNLLEDYGAEQCKEYIDQFSQDEKIKMMAIYNQIKKHGVEAVKRNILERTQKDEYDRIVSGEETVDVESA